MLMVSLCKRSAKLNHFIDIHETWDENHVIGHHPNVKPLPYHP